MITQVLAKPSYLLSIRIALLGSLLAFSCVSLSAFETTPQKAKIEGKVVSAKKMNKDQTTKKKKKSMLRHVVAFKFKEKASEEQIKELVKAFRGLKKKIPQIGSFETGTNNSPEKLNKGHTHAFILTFSSEEDRDAYLVHPDHKEFGKLVGPIVDDVFVIDYWANK